MVLDQRPFQLSKVPFYLSNMTAIDFSPQIFEECRTAAAQANTITTQTDDLSTSGAHNSDQQKSDTRKALSMKQRIMLGGAAILSAILIFWLVSYVITVRLKSEL